MIYYSIFLLLRLSTLLFQFPPPPLSPMQGDSGGEDKGADIHSEEHVLPGSLAEMNEFESHAFNTARYLISGHLPEVRIHLPSKQFFEALYNRYRSMEMAICARELLAMLQSMRAGTYIGSRVLKTPVEITT